jgi:tyrosyl-tRNA synthetase
MKRSVEEGANPRDIKFELAKEIVSRFHGGPKAGQDAMLNFIARFQQREIPADISEIELAGNGKGLALPRLLKEAGLTASTSEAMRLIKQGGVRIDGEKAEDPALEIPIGESRIFQVGKRKFMRIRVR